MARQPGPRQNFPAFLTRINFPTGRFLVIEIYHKGKNTIGEVTVMGASFNPSEASKVMPFDPAPDAKRGKKPADLDLKNDVILTSGAWENQTGNPDANPPQDVYNEFRRLIFINVPLAEKDQPKDEKHIEYRLKLKGIEGTQQGSGSTAYFVWTEASDRFGLPPPPTANDVFTVINVETLIGPYNGVWIAYVNNDLLNGTIIPGWRAFNANYGLPLPEVQVGPFGGWTDQATQLASIAAMNAGLNLSAEIAGTTPNNQYYPITYEFPPTPDNTKPEIQYEIRAGYYSGRLNFPYDEDTKEKKFPEAKDDTTAPDAADRYAEYSTTKTKPSSDTTITIRLSPENKVSIS